MKYVKMQSSVDVDIVPRSWFTSTKIIVKCFCKIRSVVREYRVKVREKFLAAVEKSMRIGLVKNWQYQSFNAWCPITGHAYLKNLKLLIILRKGKDQENTLRSCYFFLKSLGETTQLLLSLAILK